MAIETFTIEISDEQVMLMMAFRTSGVLGDRMYNKLLNLSPENLKLISRFAINLANLKEKEVEQTA